MSRSSRSSRRSRRTPTDTQGQAAWAVLNRPKRIAARCSILILGEEEKDVKEEKRRRGGKYKEKSMRREFYSWRPAAPQSSLAGDPAASEAPLSPPAFRGLQDKPILYRCQVGLYSVQFTEYSVQFTVYSVHCTLYNVN